MDLNGSVSWKMDAVQKILPSSSCFESSRLWSTPLSFSLFTPNLELCFSERGGGLCKKLFLSSVFDLFVSNLSKRRFDK